MRFFRTDSDELYESARIALDSSWGHATPTTCIQPASSSPRDAAGRIVLAVNDEFCEYQASVEMLANVIGSGAVEEITKEIYMAAVQIP
jgi:hypothetical protein